MRGHHATAVLLVLDDALDDERERRQLDRLREELLRALLHGHHGELDRAMTGQHDDRHVDALLFDVRQQIEGGAVWKRVVDEREIGHLRPQMGGGRGKRVGFVDVVPEGFKIRPHAQPRARLVVDDEHSTLNHECPPSSTTSVLSGCVFGGTTTVMTAPPAEPFAAVSRQLCSSMIRWLIARPSPNPPLRRLKNGVNRRGRSARAMPGPWSRTVTSRI